MKHILDLSSIPADLTEASDSVLSQPVESMAESRNGNGLSRDMNILSRGFHSGDGRTPLGVRDIDSCSRLSARFANQESA